MANSVATIIETEDVTIADGESLSPAVSLKGRVLVGVRMDSGWNAAGLTFQECDTFGGTYQNVYDETDEVSITTVAASRTVLWSSDKLIAVKNVRLRSGTSSSAVNQTGDTVVTLLLAAPTGR